MFVAKNSMAKVGGARVARTTDGGVSFGLTPPRASGSGA
jgi:hypothetical protein